MTPRLRLEALESRLTPADLFVDNAGDLVVTTDTAPAGLSTGDTVRWDPGAGSGHFVGRQDGLTFGTTAFSTIAAALAATAAGDTIRVGPGTFNETVTVNRSVSVLGNQTERLPSNRTGPETVVRSAGTAFNLTRSNVTLSGFTIEGLNSNSTGVATATPLQSVLIDRNIITGHKTGLRLNTAVGGARSSVRFNLFQDNDSTPDADAILSDQRLENVTIHLNDVTGSHPGAAIEIDGTSGTGRGVLIAANTLTGPGTGAPMGIRFGHNVPDTSQVAIRNNFINGWFNAVRLDSVPPEVTIRANHLAGNQAEAVRAAGSAVIDVGFNFYGPTDEAVVANLVSGNVDFRPFLANGTDLDPTERGFQPILRAARVSGTTATYLDPDGDLITVKVSKGALSDSDFTFALPDRGDGLILELLNLSDDGPEFARADVTITARRTAAGGDGLASQVESIEASGVDLGAVMVRGHLGGLSAGDADETAASPAVKALDFLATAVRGDVPLFGLRGPVGSFRCRGDLSGFVTADAVGTFFVGGSVLQTSALPTSIRLEGNAGSVTVRGDLLAEIDVSGDIGRLTVGGSVVGTLDDDGSPIGGIRVGGRSGPIAIGRDLRGEVFDLSGRNPVLVPVVVSVLGRKGPATQAAALALASLTVGGSVTNAQVLVGYRGSDPQNPDAAAGPILVKGAWTASTLAVGVEAGADDLFGTADDAPIAPGGDFTDSPAVVARAAGLTVLGPAMGTIPHDDGRFGSDHFGLAARAFGRVTLAGLVLPLTAGQDRLAIGPTLDFRLVEV